MKKTLLIALTLLGLAVGSYADEAFSNSFGNYHFTPRHHYTGPDQETELPSAEYAPAPVYQEPVYQTHFPTYYHAFQSYPFQQPCQRPVIVEKQCHRAPVQRNCHTEAPASYAIETRRGAWVYW